MSGILRPAGAGLVVLVASAMAATQAMAACEGGYPTKPVTIIVPFPAGSATDTAARRIGESLRQSLGQNFLVENVPGADGTVAARRAADAEADGYTLFVTTNTTHAVNPSVYRELPYDPVKDFAPVGGIMRISYLLAVPATSPHKSFDEFRAAAQAGGTPMTYGSGNMGGQVSGELLRQRLGIDLVNVPYRGTPQGLADLAGGRIDIFFPDPASALGLIDQIRILGVTGPKRVGSMPDIPTLAEQGVEDFSVAAWVVAFAPDGTPDAVVSCLNTSLNAALADQETVDFIGSIGGEVMRMTPAELGGFVSDEIVRWKELVEVAKIEKR